MLEWVRSVMRQLILWALGEEWGEHSEALDEHETALEEHEARLRYLTTKARSADFAARADAAMDKAKERHWGWMLNQMEEMAKNIQSIQRGYTGWQAAKHEHERTIAEAKQNAIRDIQTEAETVMRRLRDAAPVAPPPAPAPRAARKKASKKKAAKKAVRRATKKRKGKA